MEKADCPMSILTQGFTNGQNVDKIHLLSFPFSVKSSDLLRKKNQEFQQTEFEKPADSINRAWGMLSRKKVAVLLDFVQIISPQCGQLVPIFLTPKTPIQTFKMTHYPKFFLIVLLIVISIALSIGLNTKEQQLVFVKQSLIHPTRQLWKFLKSMPFNFKRFRLLFTTARDLRPF